MRSSVKIDLLSLSRERREGGGGGARRLVPRLAGQLVVVASVILLSSCGGGSSRGFTPRGKVLKERVSNPDDSLHAQAPPAKTTATGIGSNPDVKGGEGAGGDEGATGEPEEDWPAWAVRDYFETSIGEWVPIVDGRVIIYMKDPPQHPDVDPNYFDDESIEPAPGFYPSYPPVIQDPRVEDFLTKTGATSMTDWRTIRAFAVYLPPNVSVEEAVTEWPSAYSEWMDACEPDFVCEASGWPEDYYDYWLLDASWNGSGHLHGPPDQPYGMRFTEAWLQTPAPTNAKIALVDIGVQRWWDNGLQRVYYTDLNWNLTWIGVNVGERTISSRFEPEGGQGWKWIRDLDWGNAYSYDHGTLSAGAMVAWRWNDPGSQLGGLNDVAGACSSAYGEPQLFPIGRKWAWKAPRSVSNTITWLNCYDAIGAVKRVYDPRQIWYDAPWLVGTCPHYNIEIAVYEFSSKTYTTAIKLHCENLSKYILQVAPAGNDHGQIRRYPAAHPRVLAVGAYDAFGERRSYSNHGPWIFCGAPDGYQSTDPIGCSPPPGNYPYGIDVWHETANYAGTSAAGPLVAASALLVQYKYPNWSPNQVKERLRSSIIPLPDPSLPGYIDAVLATR